MTPCRITTRTGLAVVKRAHQREIVNGGMTQLTSIHTERMGRPFARGNAAVVTVNTAVGGFGMIERYQSR